MKWFTRTMVLVAMLGVAGMSYGADPAKKEARQKNKPVRGQVVGVEEQGLKIKSPGKKGEGPTEQVVKVNEKTKVEIEGKAAKLADLKAGQRVLVAMDGGVATRVETLAKPNRKDDVKKGEKKDDAKPNKKAEAKADGKGEAKPNKEKRKEKVAEKEPVKA